MICLHITKEKHMENNVLVIGNGYDLAHNLKTKYDDFIQYIRAAEEDDSFILKQEDREFIHKCIETNGFLNYFFRLHKRSAGMGGSGKINQGSC